MVDEAVRSEEGPIERLKPVTEALKSGSLAERRAAADELTHLARPAIRASQYAELQAALALMPAESMEEMRTIALLSIRSVVERVEEEYGKALAAAQAAFGPLARPNPETIKAQPSYQFLRYFVERLGEPDMVQHIHNRQAQFGSKKFDTNLVYEVATATTAFPYAGDTEGILLGMHTVERLVGPYKRGRGENDVRALIPANTARALCKVQGARAALDFLKKYAEPYANDPLISDAYYYVLKRSARELYAAGYTVKDLVALADRYVKPTLGKLTELPREFGDWAKQKPSEGEEDTRTPYEQFLGFLADEYVAWQEAQKPQSKAA